MVAAAVSIVLSAAVTLLMLWPALSPGYLLYRDFVTVPDPTLSPRTWGYDGSAPRAVPLDALMAWCDPVVPTWLQQKMILLGSLWLGGAGVAVLLRHRGPLVAGLGGVVGTWSPYPAERLLLGQAPTLLAWSMLPWLVAASIRPGRPRRRVALVVLAAVPAALTPTGGLTAACAAVALSVLAGRSRGETGAVMGLGVAWCLPWLVPALGGRTGAGDSAGAAAFRVDSTGPSGVLDILTGGGVWAEGARLASRDEPAAVAAMTLLLLLAALGTMHCGHSRRRLLWLGLVVPPVLVLLLASPIGLPAFAAAQSVPGVALFRDTHRLLAISAFAFAVAVPLGVGRLVDLAHQRVGEGQTGVARRAVVAGAVCAGAAVVLLASPDAPMRLRQAYVPVDFPPDWSSAVALVAGDRTLVLPWQPMRLTPWNGDRPFLDPLPRALPGDVIAASDLVVERDGEWFEVGSSDPSAATGWREGRIEPTELGRLGITKVVEWRQSPGVTAAAGRLRLLSETSTFRIWGVP
ncbi:hypothetical protein IDVR_25140 [Intrasporangium sp. DVR]